MQIITYIPPPEPFNDYNAHDSLYLSPTSQNAPHSQRQCCQFIDSYPTIGLRTFSGFLGDYTFYSIQGLSKPTLITSYGNN